MPRVLIAADVCPIEGNRRFFMEGDAKSLLHDLLPEFEQADLAIVNLECPLIEAPSPILKTGPTFGEPPECIRGIRAAGIDVVCLANNHIMDHGPRGLATTMATCASAGIQTVGAGVNLAAAREILVRDLGGLRVGILAVAEHEFSIATRDQPGAAPLDPIDFVRNVRANQGRFDYLIVLLHGAAEFHVPTPRIKDTCQFLIEAGADAVVVQHPHCLGGYESYQHGWIIYGQGALLMDEAIYRDRASFHDGFLVKLQISGPKTAQLEIVPFRQSDPVPGARRLPASEEGAFRARLQEASRQAQDPALVEAAWIRFCEAQRHGYLSALLGHGGILRRLNRRGWLERLVYGKRKLTSVRNLVYCETHREALQTLFDRRIG